VLVWMVLVQPSPGPIGWTELQRVKVLLEAARSELAPEQYEALGKELGDAEAAFQKFSTLARASGQAAEVARGAEALTGAQRASQVAEDLGETLGRVGPALVALALLWPSSTATQSEDYPKWLDAKLEAEAKLRELSAHSRQVAAELEAA